MLRLVRQNPAVRTLPKWLLMSGVTAALFINALTLNLWRRGEPTSPLLLVSVVWLAATLFLLFGEVRTRCSPFDIALPIPTRKVWLSHLFAVIVAGVAIVTATVIPIAGGMWLLRKLSGQWMVPMEGMGGMGLQVIAGLVLAVVLIENPTPGEHRLARTKRRVAVAVAVMVVVLALALVLDGVSPWAALIPLVLAAVVARYRMRFVPTVYSLATVSSAGAEFEGREALGRQWEAVGAGKNVGGLAFDRFLNRTVLRSFLEGIKLKQSPWVTYPFVVAFGFLISGVDGRWIEDSMRFNYIWMTAYVLFSFTMHPPKQIWILDGLPVSRLRIFNLLIAPLVILLIAGYGSGLFTLLYLDHNHPRPLEVIHLVKDRESDNYYLRVPYRVLEIAWDGRVPDTVAPWGETGKPWRHSLLPGAKAKLYSPYSTPAGSSIDFVAWQMSRVVEAVYGATVSPDELKARYLREKPDGGAALKEKRLTFSADHPGLRPLRSAGPVFPVVLGLSFSLWMLALAAYFQAFRAGISNGRRLATAFGLLALFMLGWLSVLLGPIVRVLRSGLFNGGLTAALARAGESAAATAAVWIGMAFLCAATYGLALQRFEKMEAIRERKASPVG